MTRDRDDHDDHDRHDYTVSEYQSYDELSRIVDSLPGPVSSRIAQCLDNAVRSILLCHCGIDARRYDDLTNTIMRVAASGKIDESMTRYQLLIAVAAGIVPRHTLDMVWDDDDLLMAMAPVVDPARVMAALGPIMAVHEPMLFRKMKEMASGG